MTQRRCSGSACTVPILPSEPIRSRISNLGGASASRVRNCAQCLGSPRPTPPENEDPAPPARMPTGFFRCYGVGRLADAQVLQTISVLGFESPPPPPISRLLGLCSGENADCVARTTELHNASHHRPYRKALRPPRRNRALSKTHQMA